MIWEHARQVDTHLVLCRSNFNLVRTENKSLQGKALFKPLFNGKLPSLMLDLQNGGVEFFFSSGVRLLRANFSFSSRKVFSL